MHTTQHCSRRVMEPVGILLLLLNVTAAHAQLKRIKTVFPFLTGNSIQNIYSAELMCTQDHRNLFRYNYC